MVGGILPKRKLPGCRILVVEDDYFIANDVSDFLSALDCDVVGPFSSIEDSLREIDHRLPDGAVLDVNVAGRAVYPLARVLMQRKVPLLFVTGYDSRNISQTFKAVPHLTKPISANRLQNAVIQMILDAQMADPANATPGKPIGFKR